MLVTVQTDLRTQEVMERLCLSALFKCRTTALHKAAEKGDGVVPFYYFGRREVQHFKTTARKLFRLQFQTDLHTHEIMERLCLCGGYSTGFGRTAKSADIDSSQTKQNKHNLHHFP